MLKNTIRYLRGYKKIIFIFDSYKSYYLRNFTSPAPRFIKMRTLVNFAHPQGTWLETGTYMGDTSRYLAKRYKKIISIEPSDYFFKYSQSRLQRFNNIHLINGTSEEHFEKALISATPIANIWLDGHFSEGGTYLGENMTPILHELESICRNKSKFESVVIFIDDIRCFPRTANTENGYPQFQFLIDWCNENGFEWQVQNDILIAEMN
jgi:hypothetical protein